MKTSKIRAILFLASLSSLQCMAQDTQEASSLAANGTAMAATNLATAIQAAAEMQGLWPGQPRAYFDAFLQIEPHLTGHGADPVATQAIQRLYGDILALPTKCEDAQEW